MSVACMTDALVLADVKPVVVRNAAVILERFGAHRLFVKRRHGDVADLEQLGRGEEDHVGRVVVEGVYDAAFVKEDGADVAAFELDAAGEAGGARADDDDVHSIPSTEVYTCASAAGRADG